MARPHDSLFKFTFADALETGCLLRSLLPEPLAVLLRAAALETVPSRAAGPGLRIDETDLLFVARLPASEICMLPLLEHDSYRDARLLRQSIGYVAHTSAPGRPSTGSCRSCCRSWCTMAIGRWRR